MNLKTSVLLPPNLAVTNQTKDSQDLKRCAFVHKIIKHRAFHVAIVLTIVINTFSLGADHEGIETDLPELKQALDIINYMCLAIFLGEMILKHIALSYKYWQDSSNIFDGLVVLIGLVEVS